MAEPQAATQARGKSDAERGRGDGPQAQPERASWAEASARAREGVEQQVAGAEQASEALKDWTSTLMTLYAHNMSLASRRSRALADYWEDLARARQPTEALNATTSYWSRMISDYSNFTAGEGAVVREMMTKGRPGR
jgi:hypothetical protein